MFYGGPRRWHNVRRADVGLDELNTDTAVGRRFDVLVELDSVIEVRLLHLWQNERRPAPAWTSIISRRVVFRDVARREGLGHVVVVLQRQTDLLQVVHALRPGRCLPHFLNRGHEQADQYANDGDDDQEFNQRERAVTL